jgi:2-methylisocitrate lyase-like PEP mutase family enzyme
VAGEKESLDLALARGNAYRKAGADCIFVPGLLDEATVVQLVKGIQAPINTILNPKFHDIEDLRRNGVRRLSVGSGPVRSVFNHLLELAKDLSADGTADMMDLRFSYGSANDFFTK